MGECRLNRAEMESQLQLAYSCFVTYGPDFVLFVGLNRVSDDGSYGDYYWMIIETGDDVMGDDHHWVKTGTAEERLRRSKERVQVLDPRFRTTVEKTEVEGIKKVTVCYMSSRLLFGNWQHVENIHQRFVTNNGVFVLWPQTWYDALIEDIPPINRVILIGDAAHPMTPSKFLLCLISAPRFSFPHKISEVSNRILFFLG